MKIDFNVTDILPDRWFRWNAEKNGYEESVAPAAFADWPKPPYYPVSFL